MGKFKSYIYVGLTIVLVGLVVYTSYFMERPANRQVSLTFASGDKYEGEVKDNNFNGQGTYTWANGAIYVGEFKDGKRHGYGEYIGPTGNKYVGEFKDDKRHGQGTWISTTGSKYVGEFKDGEPTGEGTWTTTTKQKATTPSPGTSRPSCGHESCLEEGPFLCMGMNNTCPNTTSCAQVFYCNTCR